MSGKEFSLNQANLACTEALDDFKEAYEAAYDVYEPIMRVSVEEC